MEKNPDMNIRIGEYYKIFTLKINGIKYYFIGSIKNGGFRWVYTDSEKAIYMFEAVEKNAKKHGEI